MNLNAITASANSDYLISFLCKFLPNNKNANIIYHILCMWSLWPIFDVKNKILPSCKYFILNKIGKNVKILKC